MNDPIDLEKNKSKKKINPKKIFVSNNKDNNKKKNNKKNSKSKY
jgi:hypothetical protein